jgi:hypothetical protein
MIIPDVNVLIHAYDPLAGHHEAARKWWEQVLTSGRTVGLPWVTILGFIRVITSRKIMKVPMHPSEATGRVREWLVVPLVQLIEPTGQHAAILFKLLEELGTAGNLTTDAHLAALAIEYHAEIASTDNDFARFRGLRWFNPVKV